MSALTARSPQTFRFLDLPAEVRQLVYRQLFHGSMIRDECFLSSNPIYSVGDVTKDPPHYPRKGEDIDLSCYCPEITFTSQQIRRESIDVLDSMTVLSMDITKSESHTQHLIARYSLPFWRIKRLLIDFGHPRDVSHLYESINALAWLTELNFVANFTWQLRDNGIVDAGEMPLEYVVLWDEGVLAQPSLAEIEEEANKWISFACGEISLAWFPAIDINFTVIIPIAVGSDSWDPEECALVTSSRQVTKIRKIKMSESVDPDYPALWQMMGMDKESGKEDKATSPAHGPVLMPEAATHSG